MAVIVAAVIGVALLLGDRRETLQGQAIGATRGAVDTVAKPVSGVLAAPVRWVGDGVNGVKQYFFAVSENRRLRQRIADLSQWRDKAVALKNDNLRYQALLGLKTDPPIPMVGARVISDVHGPFANTRLADAGSEVGVRVGNPVMSDHGLVGRILGVAHGVSRVLMLTDVASRTPVMDDRSNARAILTGDGSGAPRMAFVRGNDPLKAGDRILTSGDGGLFPRGLPVGTAFMGLDGEWRVRLDSDDGPIDFVRILLFRDFSQLAEQRALSASALPPLSPAEAADVAARVSAASQPAPASSAAGASGAPPARSSAPPAAASKPQRKPAASPKPAATPKPATTLKPAPAAKPAALPKPAAKPAAAVKPAEAASGAPAPASGAAP